MSIREDEVAVHKFTQTIDCSLAEAFALVADVRRTPTWNPGVIEVSEVSDAKVSEGTQFTARVPKFGNQRMVVSELKTDETFTYSTVSPMFAGFHRWEFSASEDKTRIDHIADVSLKGIFRIFVPFLPLLRRTQRKNVHSEADAFKTYLENRGSG